MRDANDVYLATRMSIHFGVQTLKREKVDLKAD